MLVENIIRFSVFSSCICSQNVKKHDIDTLMHKLIFKQNRHTQSASPVRREEQRLKDKHQHPWTPT